MVGKSVEISSPVFRLLLDQPLVDEVVEVGIQTAVVDFDRRTLLKFSPDFLTGGVISTCDTVEEVSLEPCQSEHDSIYQK